MGTIRIASGTGLGPTEAGAFDSALASIGIERYNLITLSSVIPADASITHVDEVPDLGPTGHLLPVVMANELVESEEQGAAGLAWAHEPGSEGIFYEATGSEESMVKRDLTEGIDHGRAIRNWDDGDVSMLTETVETPADRHGCALVVATYGQARSPWR